ncbi:zinc ribbon-containing protein [Ruminococcaceae bacterium OttesenSCG-928-I18]|nr:zinc ribbon-containing protein [Ruminococcaceae bacterium OttesenSCG-928-I18]
MEDDMGTGYEFECKKCKKEYCALPGVGMMYPSVYQEALKDIKNGKYGSELQQIMNSGEYIAVNAENAIYVCRSCKHWKSDLNLSLYSPNDVEAIRTKQYGIKTVEEWGYVPYVIEYMLKEEYRLIKVFVHKCEKCGKRMHKAKDVEIENLPCPDCGTENSANSRIMFD